MKYIKFQDKNGSFSIENPENYSGLYIPLAGENGLKSAITPSLGGDSKLDQNHFLLEPVSIENLHNNRNTRNFWCKIKGKGYWSACGVSAEQEFQKYDAFFSYGREDVDEYEEMRPEGDYLRTFCIGGWDKLKDVYQMIMVYAKEHGLILQGYAYEEGLNEMSLRRGDDYITMITVAVQRES